MTGRESDNSRQDDSKSGEWDYVQRRSLVWPLVATFMAAVAVGHMISLKRRLLNFQRFARQANSTRHGRGYKNTYHYTYWTSDKGRVYEREDFPRKERARMDDPWSKIWKEEFEELERLERIRRMQEAFHRERTGYARSYEKWQEGGWNDGGQRDQQSGREDWYWGRADWEAWRNAEKKRFESSQNAGKSSHVHHYDVLGLDSSRANTYSNADIKGAFRAKAMEYHPDRNQHRKEYAEAKFREVVSSYEALKQQNRSNKDE